MALPFVPNVTVLEKRHNRGAFSCGKALLDNYIHKQAVQDNKRNISKVFILQEQGKSDIIGFYALSQYSILPGSFPPDLVKRLPGERSIPCSLLGQFAIDQAWQGKGVSEWLLAHVLEKVLLHSRGIASYALLVDAVDEEAVSFWMHFDFIQFPSTPHKLFLPMATISTILA